METYIIRVRFSRLCLADYKGTYYPITNQMVFFRLNFIILEPNGRIVETEINPIENINLNNIDQKIKRHFMQSLSITESQVRVRKIRNSIDKNISDRIKFLFRMFSQ